jgi:hypothetical protein
MRATDYSYHAVASAARFLATVGLAFALAVILGLSALLKER